MKESFKILGKVALLALLLVSCGKSEEGGEKIIEPISIAASDIKTTAFSVEWDEVVEAEHYTLKMAVYGKTPIVIKTVSADAEMEYQFSPVLAETEYKVVVVAYSKSQKIINEGESIVKTEALPQDLVGVWVDDNAGLPKKYEFLYNGTGSYSLGSVVKELLWNVSSSNNKLEVQILTGSNVYSDDKYTYSFNSAKDVLFFGNYAYQKQ